MQIKDTKELGFYSSSWQRILVIFASVIAIPFFVFAYTSPGKSSGYVNDFAKILQNEDIASLNSQLDVLKKTNGIEVAIVTIPSLGDETIDTYSVKLFQEWGIGVKGKDSGLLILVAPNDRQARIETGYGMEGIVTDLQAGNIVNKVMIPSFKNGDYSDGIKNAVNAILAIISNSPEAAEFSDTKSDNIFSNSKINFEYIIFPLMVILSILARFLSKSKSWWLGGIIGASIGIVIGVIWGLIFGITFGIFLTIAGLIFDYIVSKKGPGGGPGGFWFGPGMGGGSGGGGFGGFGGGMSGGGGASGRW